MPSSSLVEIEVEVGIEIEVEVGVEVGFEVEVGVILLFQVGGWEGGVGWSGWRNRR